VVLPQRGMHLVNEIEEQQVENTPKQTLGEN